MPDLNRIQPAVHLRKNPDINKIDEDLLLIAENYKNKDLIYERWNQHYHYPLTLVRELLAKGANPNIQNRKHRNFTPLHYAVENFSPELVKALLADKRTQQIACADGVDSTPLQFAIDWLRCLTPEDAKWIIHRDDLTKEKADALLADYALRSKIQSEIVALLLAHEDTQFIFKSVPVNDSSQGINAY